MDIFLKEEREPALASVDKCLTEKFLWEIALLPLPGLMEVIKKFNLMLSTEHLLSKARDLKDSSPVTKSLLQKNPKTSDTNSAIDL